jgi:hypothetical protein
MFRNVDWNFSSTAEPVIAALLLFTMIAASLV